MADQVAFPSSPKQFCIACIGLFFVCRSTVAHHVGALVECAALPC